MPDLAAVADCHSVALELADQVVGHRLAQIAATVEQRDECAPAREPDGRLPGGIATADDGDPRATAELCLGGTGGVEDARPLVGGQVVAAKSSVLRTGRQQDDARGNLAVV